MGNHQNEGAGTPEPIVFQRDGTVFTSSREVAAIFGKRHDHVLRDIRKLVEGAPEAAPNFGGFKNNDLTGESTSHYEMTRDGFTLLAMGFTGEKALKWKLRYIEAFNAMEAEIRSRSLPAPVSLDTEARKVIGGIVKSVVHSELQPIIAREIEAAIAADPRRAVLNYVSVRQLLDEAKALTKGRRSLNRRVGNELRTRAVLSPPTQPVSKCPHSGVWLFPRDFADRFMQERGLDMVRAHNDRVRGQGVLHFVQPRRSSERHA